jgi:hypothetical protein
MSSTYIYTSEKVLPYVYFGIHKSTGQFYIGSRANSKQKLPSHLDILQYQTSSKKVKSLGFQNFDWFIIAEFFNPKDAYDFEQLLIKEYWSNPLKLNGCFQSKNEIRWSTIDNPVWENKKHSDESKQKMRTAQLGKKHSPEAKANMSASRKGKARGKYAIVFQCPHCNFKGTSQSIKFHFDNCKSNSLSPNFIDYSKLTYKTKTCPHCGKTGRDGNMITYHFDNCKLINTSSRPSIECPHCKTICTSKTTAVRWHFDNCKKLRSK